MAVSPKIDMSLFAQAGWILGVDVNILVLEHNLMVWLSPTPGHVIHKAICKFQSGTADGRICVPADNDLT